MNSFLRAVLIFVFFVVVNYAILKSAPSLTTIALLLGVGVVLALALGIFTGRIAVSARERQFRPSAGAFAGAPARAPAPARAAQQPRAGPVPRSQPQPSEARQSQARQSQTLESQTLESMTRQSTRQSARQSETRQSMKNDGEIINKKEIEEAAKNNEARREAIEQNNLRYEIIKANAEILNKYENDEKENKQKYDQTEKQRREEHQIKVKEFENAKAVKEKREEDYKTELAKFKAAEAVYDDSVKIFEKNKKEAEKISDENRTKMKNFVKQYNLKLLAQKANQIPLDPIPPTVKNEYKDELQDIYNKVEKMDQKEALNEFKRFDPKIKDELKVQTTNELKSKRIESLRNKEKEGIINKKEFETQFLGNVTSLQNEVLLSTAKIEVPTLKSFEKLKAPDPFTKTPPEKPKLENLKDPGQYRPSSYKAIAAPVLQKVPVEVPVPVLAKVPAPVLAQVQVKAQVPAQVEVQAQAEVPAQAEVSA